MEIQIIHESIEGNFKNQAVVALLFEEDPGKSNNAISEWNLINLPNAEVHEVNDFFQKDFNVWKFFYEGAKLLTPPPFNHFKYMGSLTSPPCEENVVWFVKANPLAIGSTALQMIRDILYRPGKTKYDKEPNYDGSNRSHIIYLVFIPGTFSSSGTGRSSSMTAKNPAFPTQRQRRLRSEAIGRKLSRMSIGTSSSRAPNPPRSLMLTSSARMRLRLATLIPKETPIDTD